MQNKSFRGAIGNLQADHHMRRSAGQSDPYRCRFAPKNFSIVIFIDNSEKKCCAFSTGLTLNEGVKGLNYNPFTSCYKNKTVNIFIFSIYLSLSLSIYLSISPHLFPSLSQSFCLSFSPISVSNLLTNFAPHPLKSKSINLSLFLFYLSLFHPSLPFLPPL